MRATVFLQVAVARSLCPLFSAFVLETVFSQKILRQDGSGATTADSLEA
jgi:hypothetical protein